jgi:hypothetical protein
MDPSIGDVLAAAGILFITLAAVLRLMDEL